MSNQPDQPQSILDQQVGQSQCQTSQTGKKMDSETPDQSTSSTSPELHGLQTHLEEFAETGLELPIQTLFNIDPLNLTVEDADMLILHYRSKRLQFLKLEDRPKSVEKTRGPKLDPEASKASIHAALGRLIGSKKDQE